MVPDAEGLTLPGPLTALARMPEETWTKGAASKGQRFSSPGVQAPGGSAGAACRTRRIGVFWCTSMARRTKSNPASTKRFTVTLDKEDYDRLSKLADDHRPKLTLQYVVQYAVQLLLDTAESNQDALRSMADPRRGRER